MKLVIKFLIILSKNMTEKMIRWKKADIVQNLSVAEIFGVQK